MAQYLLLRKKRKNISIRIDKGEVIVSAPMNASLKAIEAFVNEKSRWIDAKQNKQLDAINAISDISNLDRILLFGKKIPIFYSKNIKKVFLNENDLLLPYYACHINSVEDKTKKKNLIKKWYKNYAKSVLKQILDINAYNLGIDFSGFSLTDARRKWGSCDSKGNIRLNWRLIMLDLELIDYVCIHELSHIKEHNHSKAFWNLIENRISDYKRHVKNLKECAVLTDLFR